MTLLINHALILDFILGSFVTITFWFSAILLYRLYRKYPFQILRYFIYGWILSPVSIFALSILLLIRMITELDEQFMLYWNILFKLMYCISILGIGLYGFGLLFISSNSTSERIPIKHILLGGILGFSMASVIMNSEVNFSGYLGDVKLSSNTALGISLVLLVVFVSFVALKQYQIVTKIRKLDQTIPQFTTKYLPFAYLFLVIGFIYLGLNNSSKIISSLPDSVWPLKLNFAFGVPLGLSGLFFTKALIKYPNLIIITPAKINHFLFVSNTTLPLFAYNSESKETDTKGTSILFSGVFSALDIVLSETIGSKSGLSSIHFGDKVIKIDRRKNFTLYTIMTEMNSVTSDITTTLSNQFENMFQDDLEKINSKKVKYVNSSVFKGFKENIHNMLFFAPLSRKK